MAFIHYNSSFLCEHFSYQSDKSSQDMQKQPAQLPHVQSISKIPDSILNSYEFQGECLVLFAFKMSWAQSDLPNTKEGAAFRCLPLLHPSMLERSFKKHAAQRILLGTGPYCPKHHIHRVKHNFYPFKTAREDQNKNITREKSFSTVESILQLYINSDAQRISSLGSEQNRAVSVLPMCHDG